MLDPVAMKHLEPAVVQQDRKANCQLALRHTQDRAQALAEPEPLRG
jgi:hypothetical protein